MAFQIPRSETKRTAAKLQPTRSSSANGNPAIFPLWNGAIGSVQQLRFLPDRNGESYIVKQTIKLPFEGVTGAGERNTRNPVTVQIPCLNQWPNLGIPCPVTEGIRHLWSGSEVEREVARARYRQLVYWFNGLVVQSTIREDKPPTNPVRLLPINSQLFSNSIKPVLMDEDEEFTPLDPTEGRDFYVRKSQNGSWASYQSSSFALKKRKLTDAEFAAVEANGLWDLKSLLGDPPTSDVVAQIEAMFAASMNGEPFDQAAFTGFRPFQASKATAYIPSQSQAADSRAVADAKMAVLRGAPTASVAA